jgi:glucosamine--fructose-6-phosphate aminotransferase (isomerizing)
LEGALKIKEIAYIYAEAYQAGEMKHGPIALLEPDLPVVCVVPRDRLREKTLSNIQEVRARTAPVISIATEGDSIVAEVSDHCIAVPATEEELYPFLLIVPLQLFAYYFAHLRGRDIDMPRNLAKSVTVE